MKLRDPQALSPIQWGARINYDTKEWRPWIPDKWVLHWGGTPVVAEAAAGVAWWEREQLRRWELFHIDTRGWAGIAYNWAIGNSGTLYRLRGNNRSAATSGDIDQDGVRENWEAAAVVFLVGQHQRVSEAAFATFRRLYAANTLTTVNGHRDNRSGTVCPGDQIYQWITDRSYLPTEPTPPPPLLDPGGNMLIIESVPLDNGGDGKTRYYLLHFGRLFNISAEQGTEMAESGAVSLTFTDDLGWARFVETYPAAAPAVAADVTTHVAVTVTAETAETVE